MQEKMLQPIGGQPIIWHVVDRCLRTKLPVILAVPEWDIPEFGAVVGEFHDDDNFDLYGYAGDEANLVGRFAEVCKKFDVDIVCRVPADNPAVEPEVILDHLEAFHSSPWSFSSSQRYSMPYGVVDDPFIDVFNWKRGLHGPRALRASRSSTRCVCDSLHCCCDWLCTVACTASAAVCVAQCRVLSATAVKVPPWCLPVAVWGVQCQSSRVSNKDWSIT